MRFRGSLTILAAIFLLERVDTAQGLLKRCITCRSRGELGSCKDPFTMNSTQIENEKAVEAVPCASGWCVKIIESQNLNNDMISDLATRVIAKPVMATFSSVGIAQAPKVAIGFAENNEREYGTATERSCLQRGPDDNEERCAYTKWNYKNVYMCFCNGDLCNGAIRDAILPNLCSVALLAVLYLYLWLY